MTSTSIHQPSNENRSLRQQLEASLAVTPSPHAWRVRQSLKDLSKPFAWIEPSQSKEDALIEAHRIATHVSPFGCGFLWCHMGRWYAGEERPEVPQMGSFSGLSEIIAVEINSKGEASVSPVRE